MTNKNTNGSFAEVLHSLFQKKNRLFLIGLAGICLIFLSDLLFKNQADKRDPPLRSVQQYGADVLALEDRLLKILESVQGAGKVRVMLTLENTGEIVYAYDEQTDSQKTQDETGAHNEQRESYKSEHIIVDAATGKQPLVEMNIEPEVKGAAIVCEGGDDIVVVKRITELVSAVLRLPTNRICVAKMI